MNNTQVKNDSQKKSTSKESLRGEAQKVHVVETKNKENLKGDQMSAATQLLEENEILAGWNGYRVSDFDATYSPEDDKLRVYTSTRFDRDEWEHISKKMGFKSAPKQGCIFAHWSPVREDFCVELCGDIEAEQTTLIERAEAKAERLESLAVKNVEKSNAFAKAASDISRRFEGGQPILVGHHSERKARKDKNQMDSNQRNATECAGKVEYWNYRALGVGHHANRKSNPEVVKRRIQKLLAELRGYQRTISEGFRILSLVEKAKTLELEDKNKFIEMLIGSCNYAPFGTWSDLSDGIISHDKALSIVESSGNARATDRNRYRVIQHLLNRLGFERSELGEVARYEGDLTPVIIQGFVRTHGAEKPKATATDSGFKIVSSVPLPLHIAEGLELELIADDWRELMQASGYAVEVSQRRKTTSTKTKNPLLNPTKEQAEKLQTLWNDRMVKACKNGHNTAKMASIEEVTQAIYSTNSKGDYARLKTIELDKNGDEVCMKWERHERVKTGSPVCRIRVKNANGFYQADSICIITDKPQKALPFDLDSLAV